MDLANLLLLLTSKINLISYKDSLLFYKDSLYHTHLINLFYRYSRQSSSLGVVGGLSHGCRREIFIRFQKELTSK
jgi:hypothetical protein